MRFLVLWALLAAASLVVMITVDFLIGGKAEFLNAWSVVERLVGRTPAAGDSVVYRTFGGIGELVVVLLVNSLIGAGLASVARFAVDKLSGS
jgi:hypothetical protein